MDSFVKSYFDEINTPEIGLKHRSGVFSVYAKSSAQVRVDGFPHARQFTIDSKHTWLGNVDAIVAGGISDFGGCDVDMLQIDGTINIAKAIEAEKYATGLAAPQFGQRKYTMQHWDWKDNQVALIMNMMRYVFLADLAANNEGEAQLHSCLPIYDDGHVALDRDPLVPGDHAASFPKWVGSVDGQVYPDWEHLSEVLPTSEVDVIDLTGLTEREALFVLAMTGPWQRSSRYLFDYGSPALTNALLYRYYGPLADVAKWQVDGGPGEAPRHIDLQTAMRATRQYICRNKLFNQYSVALALLVSLGCQMVPDTAEANIWLKMSKTIRIPRFCATRARLPHLTAGLPGLLSSRGIREWAMFGLSLPQIAIPAIVMAEAVQTGVSSRVLRAHNDSEQTDLDMTLPQILAPNTSFPALASESTRRPVPLYGDPDVYVIYRDLYIDREHMTSAVEVDCREGRGYDTFTEGQKTMLRCPILTQPGVPVLLLPLDPFDKETPFSLKIDLDFRPDEKGRKALITDVWRAWKFAWVARIMGYDAGGVDESHFLCHKRFFAANQTRWTNCLVKNLGDVDTPVVVRSLNPRQDANRMMLPPVHTRFSNAKVHFELNIWEKGTMSQWGTDETPISQSTVHQGVVDTTMIRLVGVSRLEKIRGFVVRQAQDFRFVEDVIADIIPSGEPDPKQEDALPVDDGN